MLATKPLAAFLPRCFDYGACARQLPALAALTKHFASAPAQQSTELTVTDRVSLEVPLSTNRPKLCVLGTGWAAARLLSDIDPKAFDLTVRTYQHCHRPA